MKNLKKYVFNSLAGMLFIALLAVNVQVGSGSSFLGIGDTTISQAKANCPLAPDICYVIEWPDGEREAEYGEPIIVTPE